MYSIAPYIEILRALALFTVRHHR